MAPPDFQDAQDGEDRAAGLARRAQRMDLRGLSARLAALDEEQAHREASTDAVQAQIDTSSAEEILARLEQQLTHAEPGDAEGFRAAISRRKEALTALLEETRRKLEAAQSPEMIGQGLLRLEDAVYREKTFEDAELAAGRALLDEFDRELLAAQAGARKALESELGLRMMPDQTGEPIRLTHHNIVASQSGEDALRESTVARQEAPGWLLGEDVLSLADVVRYTCPRGAPPQLPDLEDVRSESADHTMFGQRREGEAKGPGKPPTSND